MLAHLARLHHLQTLHVTVMTAKRGYTGAEIEAEPLLLLLRGCSRSSLKHIEFPVLKSSN